MPHTAPLPVKFIRPDRKLYLLFGLVLLLPLVGWGFTSWQLDTSNNLILTQQLSTARCSGKA